ncbi:MAG: DNA-directed RNA polymerase subunit alpha [Bacteroidota bacterium]|nr:DNA-directed RNA polymerase subunit alpha [Bacteroidota bacterium]
MAIIDFQKPEKVIQLEADEYLGKFEFRPLEPGFGMTIGNAIRRILLSSLEGYAITRLKIDGIEHEFSTITGVVEDVTDIILNLKQIRFKKKNDGNEEDEEDEEEVVEENLDGEKIFITLTGQESFTAGDLDNFLTNFEVINKDLLICTLEPFVKFQIEMDIEKGRGYVQAEVNEIDEMPFGTIPIDSIFTPIKNVKYDISNYRVGQQTDYEKLTMEIFTDGSITPKDALKEAAKILIHHFMLFSDEKITLETKEKKKTQEFDEEFLRIRQLLKKKLIDMDLSVRALNCLKSADVDSLGDLVSFQKEDLLKFRNFGKKSLSELENLLETLSLDFGMDIRKYRIEEE